MKKELFAELMGSMGEALDHARGKRELRTTVLPAAPAAMNAADIRKLRDSLNTSQAVFARLLNVSTRLVQAWEANRRQPEGAALRLLEVVKREPSVVFAEIKRPAMRASLKSSRTRKAAVRSTNAQRTVSKR
jgi:putative transcriptional regulator